MAETLNLVPENQFDGEGNLTEGSRKGPEGSRSGETLVDWMHRFKAGQEVFAAGGNSDIVFATAFPDANYRIVFGPTTTTALPIWANKVATGFRITAAAAGTVDWIVIHDGFSS